jgi:hypothetical protein
MNSEWSIGNAELALRAAPKASDCCTSSIHNSEFTIHYSERLSHQCLICSPC